MGKRGEGPGWGKGGEVSLPHSKFLDRPLLQWHIRKIGLVCHPQHCDHTRCSESLDSVFHAFRYFWRNLVTLKVAYTSFSLLLIDMRYVFVCVD